VGVSVPSIAITSLTSCVALLVAGTTEVPALRSFCITAGVGIIITFVPVIMVFPGVLLLNHAMHGGGVSGDSGDHHQRSRNRGGGASGGGSGGGDGGGEGGGWGGGGSGFRSRGVLGLHRRHTAVVRSGGGGGMLSGVARIFSVEGYMCILRCRVAQVSVCIIYIAVLAASCYAASLVEDGIEVRDIARVGGALDRFLALQDRCGSHMGPPLFIVVKGVDFLDYASSSNSNVPAGIDVARGMQELVKSIEADPYVDGPVFGWYEEFTNAWLPFNEVEAESCSSGSSDSCDSEKRKMFCENLDTFLTDSAEGEPFKHDVVLRTSPSSEMFVNSSRTSLFDAEPIVEEEEVPPCEVVIAQLRTLHVPLGGTRETLAAIKSARRSVDPARFQSLLGPDVEIYPQSVDYVYFEQFLSARREHLVRIGAAVLAIGRAVKV
jgi:hypothetical protein